MSYEVSVRSLVRNKLKSAPAGETPSGVKSYNAHKRSTPPLSTILKAGWRMLQRPDYIKVFVQFQAEKEMFNVLYPNKQDGIANKMRQVSFRITDVCNLRCHTCCQWGDNGYLLDRKLADLYKAEIPSERYIEILRDLKSKGHQPLLYFWGGEPTMYRGLVDVIEEGARLGMAPTLVTNALNLSKIAERLVLAPLAFIQLSIDGHTREVQNYARPGADNSHDNFQDVVDGLEALYQAREKHKRYMPMIGTITTVSRANYNSLIDIYERFKHRVDLFIFNLSWWIDPESSARHEEDFEKRFGQRPTLHRGFQGEWNQFDVHELSRQIKELQRRSLMPGGKVVYVQPGISEPEDLLKYYTDHNETFGYDQCVSIFQNPEIDSNGNVSPCRDYHDYVVGNLRTQTLTDIWNSQKYVDFRKSVVKDGLMPVCTRCCGLMGY